MESHEVECGEGDVVTIGNIQVRVVHVGDGHVRLVVESDRVFREESRIEVGASKGEFRDA